MGYKVFKRINLWTPIFMLSLLHKYVLYERDASKFCIFPSLLTGDLSLIS